MLDDTPIMVVVNTVNTTHLTRVIDLKGGDCDKQLPALGNEVNKNIINNSLAFVHF